jgi:uncharacterized RDD family membrane protein YckC
MSFFNTVTIRTPESVELEFVLAGVGSRAVALTLDYLCLGSGLLGLAVIYSFLLVRLLAMDSVLSIPSETVQLWVTAIAAVLAFTLYIGYFALFETWWYGQTPGKRYAKIRVIRDDGQPERLPQATLRSLLRPIDDILFIGFFCILLSKTEKRVGDWLAGTLVVQNDAVASGEIQVPERSQAIGTDLLALVDITDLSPDDCATGFLGECSSAPGARFLKAQWDSILPILERRYRNPVSRPERKSCR